MNNTVVSTLLHCVCFVLSVCSLPAPAPISTMHTHNRTAVLEIYRKKPSVCFQLDLATSPLVFHSYTRSSWVSKGKPMGITTAGFVFRDWWPFLSSTQQYQNSKASTRVKFWYCYITSISVGNIIFFFHIMHLQSLFYYVITCKTKTFIMNTHWNKQWLDLNHGNNHSNRFHLSTSYSFLHSVLKQWGQ